MTMLIDSSEGRSAYCIAKVGYGASAALARTRRA
jgi:hypothetical protein